MDTYTAIRIRAFRNVQRPTGEYVLRKIMRWYSKTFSTPIAVVEEMPIEDLLQAHYEERYEAMSEEDLETEKADILLSEEERAKRVADEEANDAEMWEMGRLVAEEEAARKKKAAPAPGQKSQEGITQMMPEKSPLRPMPGKDSELPGAGEVIPPAIEMKFMSEADLEAELAGIEALADGRKK